MMKPDERAVGRPSSSVVAQVLDVAASVFGVSRNALTPQSAPDDVESWDSVHHLTLILALEQQFGVTLSLEGADDTATLEGIATSFERMLADGAAPREYDR